MADAKHVVKPYERDNHVVPWSVTDLQGAMTRRSRRVDLVALALRCARLLHSSNVPCTKSEVKQVVEESHEMPANWHKISCTTPILWTT